MERKYTYLLNAFEFFQKMLDTKHTDYGAPITFFSSEKATSRSQLLQQSITPTWQYSILKIN